MNSKHQNACHCKQIKTWIKPASLSQFWHICHTSCTSCSPIMSGMKQTLHSIVRTLYQQFDIAVGWELRGDALLPLADWAICQIWRNNDFCSVSEKFLRKMSGLPVLEMKFKRSNVPKRQTNSCHSLDPNPKPIIWQGILLSWKVCLHLT